MKKGYDLRSFMIITLSSGLPIMYGHFMAVDFRRLTAMNTMTHSFFTISFYLLAH